MPKFTILRGVSGSGKSTYAESQEGNPVVVSRDRIRVSLFGTEDFTDEDLVTKVEHAMIRESIKAGRDVISDNTNIMWKFVRENAAVAKRAGADIEIVAFDIPLDKAISRNARRASLGGRNVPLSVIKRQHERFQSTKDWGVEDLFLSANPAPYNGTPGKPKAFLVDLDGTLAHMNGRSPYDWKAVGDDDPDNILISVVNQLADYKAHGGSKWLMIVMSGRDQSCRDETREWLESYGVWYDYLYMREEGDMRRDHIVKAELFDKYVRDNFDVQFVLDDRQQVVDMWREMGIKCLQVAEGNF